MLQRCLFFSLSSFGFPVIPFPFLLIPLSRLWLYPFGLLSTFSLSFTLGSRLSIVRLQMTGIDDCLLPIWHRCPRSSCSLSLSFWISPPKLSPSFQNLCSNMLIHIMLSEMQPRYMCSCLRLTCICLCFVVFSFLLYNHVPCPSCDTRPLSLVHLCVNM